jgi:hypothetical protein
MRRKTLLLVLALSGLTGGFFLGLSEREAAAQLFPPPACGSLCFDEGMSRGCSNNGTKVRCTCSGGYWRCGLV